MQINGLLIDEYCDCNNKKEFIIEGLIQINDEYRVVCSECKRVINASVDTDKWRFVTGSLIKE